MKTLGISGWILIACLVELVYGAGMRGRSQMDRSNPLPTSVSPTPSASGPASRTRSRSQQSGLRVPPPAGSPISASNPKAIQAVAPVPPLKEKPMKAASHFERNFLLVAPTLLELLPPMTSAGALKDELPMLLLAYLLDLRQIVSNWDAFLEEWTRVCPPPDDSLARDLAVSQLHLALSHLPHTRHFVVARLKLASIPLPESGPPSAPDSSCDQSADRMMFKSLEATKATLEPEFYGLREGRGGITSVFRANLLSLARALGFKQYPSTATALVEKAREVIGGLRELEKDRWEKVLSIFIWLPRSESTEQLRQNIWLWNPNRYHEYDIRNHKMFEDD